MEKALTAMVSSLTPTRLIVALISGGARYLLENISEHILCSLAFRQIFFFFRIPIFCVAANNGFLLILVNSVKHNR